MARTDFTSMFHPRGIAVVGANNDLSRPGRQTIHVLDRRGYQGRIYPVNPRYEEIAGHRCYPSLLDVDGPVDVAVIVLQAKYVPEAITQCSAKGIRFAVVVGGGFREVGPEGEELERQMIAAARAGGVRFIGPNCLGFKNVHDNVFCGFGSITRPPDLEAGPVSAIIQSGGYGNSMVIQCANAGIGYRYLVASGSESDIGATEIIEAYVDDPGTKVILAYLEGVNDGRAFMAAAKRALAARKPIVLIKSGNSRQGAKAAASHTAFLAGSYDVYRSAFKQCGVIEVLDIPDAMDVLQGMVGGRFPQGRRVAVMSGSGGSLVSFSDAADDHALTLTPFLESTQAILRENVPSIGFVGNPVDFTAGYQTKANMPKFKRAIEAVLADPGIDQLGVFLATASGENLVSAAEVVLSADNPEHKPLLVFSALPQHMTGDGRAMFVQAGIPFVSTPRKLAAVMGRLADYSAALARADRLTADYAPNRTSPPQLPATVGALDEHTAKEALRACGLPVTRDALLPPDASSATLPQGLAYPVAVKIVSPDVAHKTDVGGVTLNVDGDAALRDAIRRIVDNTKRARPDARLTGVLVSEMVQGGIETIVGILNDPVFGPVVVFGMGGILAETLRDTTLRVAPFDVTTAREMIGELRAAAIFQGVRGQAPRDVEALAQMLSAVSEFAWAARGRLREADLNPVLVCEIGRGVVIADAMMVLG